jgi:hypothetical protein
MPRNYKQRRNVSNVSDAKLSYRKRRKMDQRTITREISNDDLCAALELLYRSMGIIKPSEDITNASFGPGGSVLVTFTIAEIQQQGVESISFK